MASRDFATRKSPQSGFLPRVFRETPMPDDGSVIGNGHAAGRPSKLDDKRCRIRGSVGQAVGEVVPDRASGTGMKPAVVIVTSVPGLIADVSGRVEVDESVVIVVIQAAPVGRALKALLNFPRLPNSAYRPNNGAKPAPKRQREGAESNVMALASAGCPAVAGHTAAIMMDSV